MQHEVLSALEKIITARQALAGRKPIAEFAGDLRQFSTLDRDRTTYLYGRREEVLRILGMPRTRGHLIAYAEAGLRSVIWRHNQFLSSRDLQPRRLAEHYAALLREVETALASCESPRDLQMRMRRVLAAHHSRLLRTSRRLVHARFRSEMPEPPCSEYSAELQCQVLRLTRQSLVEPVLDIGCGERATLVHRLRDLGVEAYGIDRMVAKTERTWQEDWLAPGGRWRQRRWGTIVSHLAFANHFVHQHLRQEGEAESYARLFIEILERLEPGGSFVYAPAVPFIEDLLPARFEVTRWRVGATGLQACRITPRY